MRPIILFPGLLFTVLLSACSIKEERTFCPCRLTLNLEDANIKFPGEELHLWFTDEQNVPIMKTIVSSSQENVKVIVPKGRIRVFSTTGSDVWKDSEEGGRLELETGNQADSIYASCSLIECTGETAADTILLHKQWCTAHILLDQSEKWESSLFELNSSWAGLSTSSLGALKGDFICHAVKAGERRLTVRIPRQGDDSLVLKIKEQNSKDGENTREKTFPLGEMIASIGYQWDKADLDDIVIRLNETKSGLYVELEDWEEAFSPEDVEF